MSPGATKGLRISQGGVCTPATLEQRVDGSVAVGNSVLHVHYHCLQNGIVILSPVCSSAMQTQLDHVFTFCLPPPLNSHVYPSPVYVARKENDGRLRALSTAAFHELCTQLVEPTQNYATDAVYDVPLVALEEEAELEDDASSTTGEESGDDASDSGCGSDNDWVSDDDEEEEDDTK